MIKKRNILLVLTLVFTALFASCTSTSDKHRTPEKPFNIVGTKWEANYHFEENNPASALVTVVFDFKTPTEVVLEEHKIKEGTVEPELFPNEPWHLSYTYTAPFVKIRSADQNTITIYKVDETTGTMETVGDEVLENGKWIKGKEVYKITLHLIK